MPFLRASKLDQAKYDAAIAKGLDRAHAEAEPERIQLADLRAVVISDLHRGARDGADDFERAEPAYAAALGHYLEEGYALWLLGDVDELWENDIEEVIPTSYGAALELERQFAPAEGGPGLRRFWGNHDLDWKDPDRVQEHLGPYLPGVEFQEALRLVVDDGDKCLGELFLAHGHQGTDFSERFQWLSRFFLRRVWRKVQASQGWLSTSPSFNFELRAKHDTAMFRWAKTRGNGVLVAGHTHHPVFPGKPPPPLGDPELEKLRAELAAARDTGDAEKVALARSTLELVEAILRRRRYQPIDINDPPCYFNGGCCCYPDGDVTCLELDGAADEIRLVRWPRESTTPDRDLPKDSLRSIFERVAT